MRESFFATITEANKYNLNKPHNSDRIYYSQLNNWFTANAIRSFSIKYVLQETIFYKIGNDTFSVRNGEFFLACKQPDVQAFFDNKRTVKSLCIDIGPATIAEVYTLMTEKKELNIDNYLDEYFKVPDFHESIYRVNHSRVGNVLRQLSDEVYFNNTVSVNKEWFYILVEQIILQEYENFVSLANINSQKLSTRKEILRRLRTGKEYIEDNFLSIENISEIAREAAMSDYHFFRSFRQAFGISPYQYLLSKKLEMARTLVERSPATLTDIASHCGFLDVFTFSKAFKRKYSVAPSKWGRG